MLIIVAMAQLAIANEYEVLICHPAQKLCCFSCVVIFWSLGAKEIAHC